MHIAVLAGDGIGPEVTAQAVKALRAVAANGPQFDFTEAPIGDAAFDTTGDPLPEATAALAERAEDLGEPGHDPLYGWGLVQGEGACEPNAVAAGGTQ